MIVFLSLVYLLATVCVYWVTKKLYIRKKWILLSPNLVCPLILISLLSFFHISFSEYNSGGQWLSYMLGPATVAFAIPMYKNFDFLKKHAVEIVSSVLVGSVVAVSSSVLFAHWIHLNPQTVTSLAPRSVTAPIAMGISQMIGGVSSMTAGFAIITGIVGLVISSLVLSFLPIRTSIAKGVMLGNGAHGAGTARAFEMGTIEGTVSSLSIIVTAGISLLFAPFVVGFLKSIL